MAKDPLPELSDTGRRYLDNTARARLASPGIERFAARRRRGALPLVLALAGALAAAVVLLR